MKLKDEIQELRARIALLEKMLVEWNDYKRWTQQSIGKVLI